MVSAPVYCVAMRLPGADGRDHFETFRARAASLRDGEACLGSSNG
jgi:hypothetical protein